MTAGTPTSTRPAETQHARALQWTLETGSSIRLARISIHVLSKTPQNVTSYREGGLGQGAAVDDRRRLCRRAEVPGKTQGAHRWYTGAHAAVAGLAGFLDRPRRRVQAEHGCPSLSMQAGVIASLSAVLQPAMPALLAVLAVYPLPLYAMVRSHAVRHPASQPQSVPAALDCHLRAAR